MEETRIVGHGARAQTAAEKIIRESEMRAARSPEGEKQPVRETTSSYLGMTRKEAPRVAGEPSVVAVASRRLNPLAGGLPSPRTAAEDIAPDAETREQRSPDEAGKWVHESRSSYLGMTRKEAPPAAAEPPVRQAKSRGSDVPTEDNPAPFSSALHIPTLIDESKSSSER